MRKTFIALCLGLCVAAVSLSGCSSSSGDPAQRAAELIKAKGVNLPPFSSMDSVMGYPEAFACEMTAIQTEWRADSALTACKANGTVNQNLKELQSYGEMVYSLRKGAAEIELREGLKHTPKEFVGYQAYMADSLSDGMIRVIMDKDMKQVAIEKINVR